MTRKIRSLKQTLFTLREVGEIRFQLTCSFPDMCPLTEFHDDYIRLVLCWIENRLPGFWPDDSLPQRGWRSCLRERHAGAYQYRNPDKKRDCNRS